LAGRERDGDLSRLRTHQEEKPGKPLLVAPLRGLRDFAPHRETILEGKAYALWALPFETPIDGEYVVDFRLIQPIAVGDLERAQHWTCLAPATKEIFQARLERFLFRAERR
jgi:hypothetical protein